MATIKDIYQAGHKPNSKYYPGMSIPDKNALFESVIEEHKGIIYKISRAYSADIDERKDLVQEIMLQVWKSFDRYDGRSKYSTWIYKIALNVSVSYHRKEKKRRDIANPIMEGPFEISDQVVAAETDANIDLLYSFINELKELDKALMLLYLDKKSHKEMSEIIGISETNVATKINRIKEKLKQKFSQIKY